MSINLQEIAKEMNLDKLDFISVKDYIQLTNKIKDRYMQYHTQKELDEYLKEEYRRPY